MRAALLRTFGHRRVEPRRRAARRGARGRRRRSASAPRSRTTTCGPSRARATAAEAEARLAEVCDAIRERLGAARLRRAATRRCEQVVGALLRRARPHARRGRVLHRRPGRRSAHRGARLLALLPRRRRRLRERRRRRRCSACPRRCSPTRCGVGRGGARDGRGRARGASAPTSRSRPPASPGPDGGTRGEARRPRLRGASRAPAGSDADELRLPARPRAPPPAHARRSRSTGCGARCSASRPRGAAPLRSAQERERRCAACLAVDDRATFFASSWRRRARARRRTRRALARGARAATRALGAPGGATT